MGPKDLELRKRILDEAHLSRYSIHPGSNKMYQDLRQRLWWTRMKREIAQYVSECDICKRVKASHLRPAGLLQPIHPFHLFPSPRKDQIGVVGHSLHDFLPGVAGIQVLVHKGAHSRYDACVGRSLFLGGFRRFPLVKNVQMYP